MISQRAKKIIAVAFFGTAASASNAALNIKFEQIGENVVATASGSVYIGPFFGKWSGGRFSSIGLYTSLPNTLRMGSTEDALVTYEFNGRGNEYFASNNSNYLASSSVGDSLGVTIAYDGRGVSRMQTVSLPQGYIEGDAINNVTTWNDTTLGEMGLLPNSQYSWWWGTNDPLTSPEAKLTINVASIPAPVPAPLPILGAVAALGWSRKFRRRIKKSQREDFILSNKLHK